MALDNNLYATTVQASSNIIAPTVSASNIYSSNSITTNYLTSINSITTGNLLVTSFQQSQFNGSVLINGNLNVIGNIHCYSNETIDQDLSVRGLLSTARLAVLQNQVNSVRDIEVELMEDFATALAGFGSIY
jgi:hypothetical protein